MGILTEDMKRLVREQKLGYVATVCPDGTPNLSPKGTTTVWDDDHLVFADLNSPGTIENLWRNPSVEINVVDPIVRKGYRFKGTTTILTEGKLHNNLASLYGNTTNGVQDGVLKKIKCIVLVKVTRALPVISPGYGPGVSEEETAAKWKAYYSDIREKHMTGVSDRVSTSVSSQ